MNIDESLEKLKGQITKLSPKKQDILSNWISVWADYLRYEAGFVPD